MAQTTPSVSTVQTQSKKSLRIKIALAVVIVAAIVGILIAAFSTPVPETVEATMRVGGVKASFTTLNRGTEVKIVSDEGDYYRVEYTAGKDGARANYKGTDTSEILVEKWLLRVEGESAPEQRQVFAATDGELYANAYLEGSAVAAFSQNDEFTLLDMISDVALVQNASGQTGYVSHLLLSEEQISEEEEAVVYAYGYSTWSAYPDDYSDSGDGGSSSQGSSGWTGGGTSSSDSGQDGTDISLASARANAQTSKHAVWNPLDSFIGVAYADEAQSGSSSDAVGKKATILSDGTSTYIAVLGLGETVKVLKEDASSVAAGSMDSVRVLVGEQIGTIARACVRTVDDPAYTAWQGYTRANTVLFADWGVTLEVLVCDANEVVSVVDDFGGCYAVEYSGTRYYVYAEDISTEEVEEEETSGGGYSYYNYSYSNGGSGSYGDGGEGGTTASSSEVIEAVVGGWTEEVL